MTLRAQGGHHGGKYCLVSGKVTSTEQETVDFATVYLKGTAFGGTTDGEGRFRIKAPAGRYTLVVSAVGYKTIERPVTLERSSHEVVDLTITPDGHFVQLLHVGRDGQMRKIHAPTTIMIFFFTSCSSLFMAM